MAKTPRAPTNMSILFTRRRFFEATRSPAPAVLMCAPAFPAVVSSDSLPPSQPGTPVGTAASTSQINWTWTASTDTGGSGLSGYRVYVDGAVTPTATVTTNSYSSTGHSAGTTHTLRVEAFDGAGNSSSSGIGSQSTQSPSSSGFTPASGIFSVTATSFAHGQAMTITRSSGSWAARTYGPHPWLYDLVSEQFFNGTRHTIHAGKADGQAITSNDAVWFSPTGVAYNGGAFSVKYSTSRPMRHPRVSAVYLQNQVEAAMKLMIGPPRWPSTWNDGTQNNARLYVRWQAHDRFAYTSQGGAYQHKLCRYNSTSGEGIGFCQHSPDSFQYIGAKFSQPAAADYWVKASNGQHACYEMFLDRVNGYAEGYCHYRYQRGGASSFAASGFPNGEYEFRPISAALYDANPSNVPFLPGWANITGALGYDGNTNTHTGQEIEVGEIYIDTEWERFEISGSPTWDVSPAPSSNLTAGTPREIQGRWSRDSASQCTVYINQGAFTSLSGKYLWYVDGFKTATLIGRFD